jgi:hypothetical protein
MGGIIGTNLTAGVMNVIEHCGNFIVAVNVSGQLDTPGLPKLLVYAFFFSADGDRIVQLITLRNRYDVRKRLTHCFGAPMSRDFAAGARNVPISQKRCNFTKSTSRRGVLYLSPVAVLRT